MQEHQIVHSQATKRSWQLKLPMTYFRKGNIYTLNVAKRDNMAFKYRNAKNRFKTDDLYKTIRNLFKELKEPIPAIKITYTIYRNTLNEVDNDNAIFVSKFFQDMLTHIGAIVDDNGGRVAFGYTLNEIDYLASEKYVIAHIEEIEYIERSGHMPHEAMKSEFKLPKLSKSNSFTIGDRVFHISKKDIYGEKSTLYMVYDFKSKVLIWVSKYLKRDEAIEKFKEFVDKPENCKRYLEFICQE